MSSVTEVAADDPRWLVLWNAVRPSAALTAEEARAWHATLPGAWLVELEGDEPVAGAFAMFEPQLPAGFARAEVVVRADRRRQGRGTALLSAIRERAQALGATSLRAGVRVEEGDPDGEGERALAWAARHGFEEVGREIVVARDVAAARPPIDAGALEVVSWADRPDLAPQLHAIASESVPDIPGEEDAVVPDLDEWLAEDMSGPNDRPEGVLVALADGLAVGYAKFHLPLARPGVAVHDLTAVRRDWRGRGVAGVLKRAQLAWAAERGYTRLETGNEERNAPIRALNARLGYRPTAAFVRLHGPVAT